MILEIVKYPNQVLSTHCTPVHEINGDIKSLANDMIETMLYNKGVGLAANQVGKPVRMLVMLDLTEEPIVMINPVILTKTGKSDLQEGCLSVPGVSEFIDRADAVTVKYRELDGTDASVSFSGIQAVCVQHEIDHLDGITFFDRMSSFKKKMAISKYQKYRNNRL